MSASTHYAVLGVQPDAQPPELRLAYRSLVKQFHPDRTGGEDHIILFHRIKDAYETLIDPNKRAQYDYWLNIGHLPRYRDPHFRRVHAYPHSAFTGENQVGDLGTPIPIEPYNPRFIEYIVFYGINAILAFLALILWIPCIIGFAFGLYYMLGLQEVPSIASSITGGVVLCISLLWILLCLKAGKGVFLAFKKGLRKTLAED